MLIIADERMPGASLRKLSSFGNLITFATKDIVYESISGHPDIFICLLQRQLVIAPNLPNRYKKILNEAGISFIEGEFPVGENHPQTTSYNVVYSENTLFHNFRYTDPVITRLYDDANLVQLQQAYTRCSLIALGSGRFITSDRGIERVLLKHHWEVLYVDPSGIQLPGQKHGLIGGCCGLHHNKVFFTGALNSISDGNKIASFCRESNYEVIELSTEPLFDGGSIFFIAEDISSGISGDSPRS